MESGFLFFSFCSGSLAGGRSSLSHWNKRKKTLLFYKEKLGEHSCTATIYKNLSENVCALGEFDQAKPYSEHALKIRRKLLNDNMDTANSLFDLGIVHKKKGEIQQAISYLEQSMNMQEN